ncbi:MAG: hypothetical protein AAFW89_04815 [Bacteroidota bacterium]
MQDFINYIPIGTTLFSVFFFIVLFRHWRRKPGTTYLLWWTVGVFCYGIGTTVESLHTLIGWSPALFKAWYISGAFLGGVPLAQGTVHLLMGKAKANTMSLVLLVILLISSTLVILSPLDTAKLTGKLDGVVLEWTFIRWITPFINIYAVIFLVGGAFYSAFKYKGDHAFKNRFWGNVWIAVGGILPGFGGSFAKMGLVEVLYVTELLGILLIFAGYQVIRGDQSLSVHKNQTTDQVAVPAV